MNRISIFLCANVAKLAAVENSPDLHHAVRKYVSLDIHDDLMLIDYAVSGEAPEEPVASRKSGRLQPRARLPVSC